MRGKLLSKLFTVLVIYILLKHFLPAQFVHLSMWLPIGILAAVYLVSWINIVDQWSRRPVMRFGKYVRTLGPGISLVEPLLHNCLSDVDIRDKVININVEEAQTKDNVGVKLDGVLTCRIAEARVRDAVVNVKDVKDGIKQRGLSTLNDETGKNDLDGLLEHRDKFCEGITTALRQRLERWGVEVVAFELKGFKVIDEEVAEAIAMKVRAEREGAAELARAQYQQRVATALNEAAATYNEGGRWLKGIETLIEIARSGKNNMLMIPTDLTESLAKLTGLISKPAETPAKPASE